MVGSRNTNQRCQRASHLIRNAIVFVCFVFSSLYGCSDQESAATVSTVVELQHTTIEEALPLIEPTIPNDIQYNYSTNKIVFYAKADELNNTLKLLTTLDRPPAQYLVEFRLPQKANTTRYSTNHSTHLPISSLQVLENKEAKVTTDETIFYPFFDEPVTLNINKSIVKITKRDSLNSELALSLTGTSKGKLKAFHSEWVVPHNRWTRIAPQAPSRNKTYSTPKKNPLDLEVRITPVSNGF